MFNNKLILTLIIVLILGSSALIIFRNSNSKSSSATKSSTVHSENESTISKEQAQTEQQNYINYDIKELGVHFQITEKLNNLNYIIKTINLSDGTTAQTAYFSTKDLEQLNAKCAADKISIAALTIGKNKYPKDAGLAYEYGPLLKQFGQSFVTFGKSRASCVDTDNETSMQTLNETMTALETSVQSIELDN